MALIWAPHYPTCSCQSGVGRGRGQGRNLQRLYPVRQAFPFFGHTPPQIYWWKASCGFHIAGSCWALLRLSVGRHPECQPSWSGLWSQEWRNSSFFFCLCLFLSIYIHIYVCICIYIYIHIHMLLKETICLLEKPQKNDYIQNGYVNVDAILWGECLGSWNLFALPQNHVHEATDQSEGKRHPG